MKRRKFIKTAASATAAAGAGVFSILKYPRNAHAGWGAWPHDDPAKAEAFLPTELQADGVLELHVNGGMSCFDTFYTVPDWGQNDYRFLYVFDENAPASQGRQAQDTLQGRFAMCNIEGDMYRPFGAQDGGGNDLFLGPWTHPFWSRPDVLARMRIVVTRHDQVAHEGANPKSFTGLGLGSPRMAGLGTAVQRYFSENEDAPGGGGIRSAPYSYVLYPAGYKPFNAVAASAVGTHPGSARPLVVSVEPNSVLTNLLAREAIDDREAFDTAVAYYRAEYEARLQRFGHSAPARSSESENYNFSVFARESAPELTEVLSDDLFAPIDPPAPADVCGNQINTQDMPRMQANMAANLLTRETDAARYVLWIDAGIEPRPTGGHDVHNASVRFNASNLSHTFSALLDQIADPDNERPGDDRRIDLSRHMVVINTEFGRQPFQQGGGTGTNHNPYGYVQIFIGGPIGGPIGSAMAGGTVYGEISETDGQATTWVSPAQSRMMILQAMGIYPFSPQSYAVAEAGFSEEAEAAMAVRDTFLGVPV